MATTEYIGPSTTQTTSKPAMSGSVTTADGEFINFNVARQWQIATNAGFTTFPALLPSPQVLQDPTSRPHRPYGSYAVMPTMPWSGLYKADSSVYQDTAATFVNGRLPQGSYWVRFRWRTDFGGAWQAWSTGVAFTIAHAPTASNGSPASAATVIYTATPSVNWVFNDPDTEDYQLKYEAQVWKLSLPGSPIVSGLVTSALKAHTFAGLDATWKDTELRWKVRLSDQDNVQGVYLPELSFFLRDLPTIAITAPATGAVITTARPIITWPALTGGKTQASYRVIVTTGATTVADSGVVVGSATTWELPTPSITVGPTYSVQLIVTDQYALSGSDTNTFTAAYTAPAVPLLTMTTTSFVTTGRVQLDWSTSTVTSGNTGWNIYRRNVGALTWTKIFATPLTAVLSFVDVTVPVNTAVEYAASQLTFSVGVTLESAYTTPQVFAGAFHPDYLLVCPGNPSLDLTLWSVTADNFSDEQEMSVQNLVGRGRRVEYGTRYGQSGSLSCDFRDVATQTGRQQRILLEALRDSGLKVYLRNPFGDVWAVALQGAQITRVAGRGLIEDSQATIDYIEITA